MKMTGQLLYPLLLVTIAAIQYSHQVTAPRVQTKLGSLVGTARETEDGNMIYSFKGIPYIKPPIGELRFKPPQPVEPWTGDFSATTENTCFPSLTPGLPQSEDCVTLNVHTPWDPSSPSPSQPYSVMVFIPGGGFQLLCPIGEPDYLLQHNVILVNINYRVGVLGFLSTEDDAAAGNFGLLDQVEALKWVKNNIDSFGGNPDSITIFGESAGAVSVQYLMLSPLTKGLFHRAVAQSGSSIFPLVLSHTARSNAQALARQLNCPEKPSEQLLNCLREKDVAEILETDIRHPDKRMEVFSMVWSPRVDSESVNPFLPRHPFELLDSGEFHKIPLLTGHNRNEGLLLAQYADAYYNQSKERFSKYPDLYCKYIMGMNSHFVPESEASEMCEKIEKTYNIERDFKKGFQGHFMKYVELLGDAYFSSRIYKASEMISRHSPVYNYALNFESKEATYGKAINLPDSPKIDGIVDHADDLIYLFKFPQFGWTKESPENKMAEMMSKIWTDFAKTGKASLAELGSPWPKASSPNLNYVVLDTEPSIQQNYKPDKMKLLDEIYSQYACKSPVNKNEKTDSDVKEEL